MLSARCRAPPYSASVLFLLQAYKNYISFILNRRNTITGVLYKDDPIIFALELANEPHTSDNYEINLGLIPGNIVLAWVYEISAYIKGISPNHMVRDPLHLPLVAVTLACTIRSGDSEFTVNTGMCLNMKISTGEEGYRVTGIPTAWYNDGSKGINFDANVACPNISFATVHLCEPLF